MKLYGELAPTASSVRRFNSTPSPSHLRARSFSVRRIPSASAPLLPAAVDDWVDAVAWFREEFDGADADGMRETLKDRARECEGDGVELKRRTDRAVRANSPYSFITYYQTLYGLRELLGPAVADGAVSVPPMQPAGERTVLEVYPAGTLRRLETVDEGYKEPTDEAAAARAEILAGYTSRTVRSPAGCIGGTETAPSATAGPSSSRSPYSVW